MATIKDIAREAGVSVTTVSYALKGCKKISDETAQKVLEAAKKLKYRPSGAARSLKASKTNNIGVYLRGFAGPVFGEVLQAIHNAVSAKGYEIMVCSTHHSDRLLIERHVDGAIILNSAISEKTIKRISSEDFPVVLMERVVDIPWVSCVVADNVQGGYNAVKHLITSGYKNIAIIAGSNESHENNARMEGAKRAFSEASIDINTIPMVYGYFDENGGFSAMQALLYKFPNIDGVFCLNDEMAMGAMQAIKQAGKSVGGDIAVIGFDNIPAAALCTPPLTTIKVDKSLWGYMAATTLIDMIENKAEKRIIQISTEIVRRQSVNRIEMGYHNK